MSCINKNKCIFSQYNQNKFSMKKILLIITCAISVGYMVQAQEIDMVSKRGVPILPEQGDIALGIDALPVFKYLGNMFNASINNTIAWNFVGDLGSTNNIYLQYYLEDNASVRLAVRLGTQNLVNQEFAVKDLPVPDPDILVTDKMLVSNTNLNIGGSYQMHRGKGRVQGYYGAGLMFVWQQSAQHYTYGNPITTEFNDPNTTDFGTNLTGTGRILDVYNVKRLGVVAHAFVGVEYFFAPKLSIGGEFGYGLLAIRTVGGSITEERWTGTAIERQTTDIANDGILTLDNHNNGANIYLKFHF